MTMSNTAHAAEIDRRIQRIMPAYLAAHSGNSDKRFRKWKNRMRKLQAKYHRVAGLWF